MVHMGFIFVMVKDNNDEFLFSDLKVGMNNFIKNNYNSKFYKWDYNKPYEKYNYTNKVPKIILEKDINTIGLIKYKMERVKT